MGNLANLIDRLNILTRITILATITLAIIMVVAAVDTTLNMTTALIVIGAALLVFGLWYAIYIAMGEVASSLTWLSVVVGDAMTNIAISAALWVLIRNPWAVAMPWLGYAISGVPMIVSQITKYLTQKQGTDLLNDIENRHD